MIGLSVLGSAVIVTRPAKDSLLEIIFPDKSSEEIADKWHYIGNTICCVTTLGASYFIPTLDSILELMGVTLFPLVKKLN